QGIENVYALNLIGRERDDKVTYAHVFLKKDQESSKYNFEAADTEILFRHFEDAEKECRAILEKGADGNRQTMAIPAYEQVVKASHNFNMLDARGVISVTERQSYILRIRELAKACG